MQASEDSSDFGRVLVQYSKKVRRFLQGRHAQVRHLRDTRSMFHKGQAIRDDIKIVRKFMGQLISNLKNL